MIWVDYTFVAIVLISLLIGALRGLVREALSLATWVLAFVVTLRYGPVAAARLESSIQTDSIRVVAGYALCFFGVLLLGAVLTLLVSLLIRGSGLSGADRMLGAGFGLLRGLFVCVAIVMLLGTSAARNDPWWRHSLLVPPLKPAADELQALIPAGWLAYWSPPEVPSAAPGRAEPPTHHR